MLVVWLTTQLIAAAAGPLSLVTVAASHVQRLTTTIERVIHHHLHTLQYDRLSQQQHCSKVLDKPQLSWAELISGVDTGLTGVDMSTPLLPEVVPEIDANPMSF